MAARLNAAQKAVVRQNLLASAAADFAVHGFAGANVNRISQSAGYARGTIYNYFESKAALFAAVVGQGTSLAVAAYRKTPGLDALSPREQLEALVRADVSIVLKEEAFTRASLAEMFSPRPETADAVQAALAPFARELVAIFARAEKDGATLEPPMNPIQRAASTMGLMCTLYAAQWRGAQPLFDWELIPAHVAGVMLPS